MNTSNIIRITESIDVRSNLCTRIEEKFGKTSFIARLYYQIFGIEIKPTIIQLDKNESYKKIERDPLINALVYLTDLFTNHCLPYRLSPIIISLPGLLLNLILLILVHASESLQRYHYIFWLISQYLTYIFDLMDGKQARRNASQSLARHYWDHWCDTMNLVISGLIIVQLYPQNLKYRLPSTVLMSLAPLGFYTNFFRYYSTGKLVEPYSLHLWNYIYVLFLSLSVIIYDVTIFNNIDYQIILGTLSMIYTIYFLKTFGEHMISIINSPIFSIKLFLMIFLSPFIWTSTIIIINLYELTNNCALEKIFFRSLALLILCNYVMTVHYRQLINQSTPFLTIDSFLFILSLCTLFIPSCIGNLILINVLISIILSINIVRLVTRLKIFINMFPEIGFPIFVISEKKLEYNNNISNDTKVCTVSF